MKRAGAALASIAVVAAAAAPWAPLVDAVTGSPAEGVELALPLAYMVLSPLNRLLDTLSLFSTPQHVTTLLTCLAVALGWALWTGRGAAAAGGGAGSLRRFARRGGLACALTLLAFVAAFLATAAARRPMAALRAQSPAEVRVDFHSHTSESHDTRASFDFERNREWHRSSGFDVAYVADHIVREGRKLADPPAGFARAGDGTVLLTAREARHQGLYIVILGFAAEDSALINERRWLQPGRLANGRMPLSIAAIPGPLADLTADALDQPPWLVGVEISDGAPRGLTQLDRERDELVALAGQLGVSLVSGSNLHGWGRTAAAWTLVSVPGWQELTPDSVGVRIEARLREGAGAPIRVVERWRPRPETVAGIVLTVPWAIAGNLSGLTWGERVAWVGWIWAIALLLGRRPPRPAVARPAELLGAR